MQDNNLISVKTYDYCAEIYEQRFMDTTPYQARVDEFCNHLPSLRSKILDLGCGPGNYSKYIAETKGFKNIHGIDLSGEMVKRAKKNVASGTFQVSDVRKLTLPDGSYHGVFSSFCIPYLSYHETEKLILDVVNLLKSSGIFYISCMEGTKSGFEQTSFSGEMPVFIYYYTEEFLVGAMEERGFQILSVNRQPYLENAGIFSSDLIIIAQKS
jgi:ubiquinone/menaquinone biosynthesis C-methylase UbiE